jgi:hydroxymethylbilane synthase
LERVGFADRIAHVFSADEMLCAVGQGIVAVECRRDDWKTREQLALIDDAGARCVALAERELLWVLNGHCNAPIAGLATLMGDQLVLRAAVMSEDGQEMMEYQGKAEAGRPRELGRAAGLELLAKGAGKIIEASRL